MRLTKKKKHAWVSLHATTCVRPSKRLKQSKSNTCCYSTSVFERNQTLCHFPRGLSLSPLPCAAADIDCKGTSAATGTVFSFFFFFRNHDQEKHEASGVLDSKLPASSTGEPEKQEERREPVFLWCLYLVRLSLSDMLIYN